MKNKSLIIKLILIGLLLGGLIYYISSKNYATVNLIPDNNEYGLANVIMNVKDDSVSKSGATIVITDKNKIKYVYEEYYKLEKDIDNVWYELKPNSDYYNFNNMGYVVNDDDTLEMNIDWSKTYGNLSSGKYRILKRVYDDGEYHYFSAEFEI